MSVARPGRPLLRHEKGAKPPRETWNRPVGEFVNEKREGAILPHASQCVALILVTVSKKSGGNADSRIHRSQPKGISKVV